MKNIKLNSEQITKLLSQNYLKLPDESIIEIDDNDIVLNSNGVINYADFINIKFLENEIDNKHVVDYLQNQLCDYLNLEPVNVLFISNSDDECLFKIHLTPNNEWKIIVCNYNAALNNMRMISDLTFENCLNADSIGLYKRLGKSQYYFRWL